MSVSFTEDDLLVMLKNRLDWDSVSWAQHGAKHR